MTNKLIPSDPAKAVASRAAKQEPFGLLTAGYMVHYSGPGQKSIVAQIGFDRRVQIPEQVYVRELVVGTDPQPLECGWVEEPGMVLVVNRAVKGSGLTLIMSVNSEPFAQALPGEGIPPFHPVSGTTSKFTLVSTGEDTPITLYAFPG